MNSYSEVYLLTAFWNMISSQTPQIVATTVARQVKGWEFLLVVQYQTWCQVLPCLALNIWFFIETLN